MDARIHWEKVYRTKKPNQVSWYQSTAVLSLGLIRRVAPDLSAAIIDVGGGASTLVDGLIAAGYRRVTVLDVSEVASPGHTETKQSLESLERRASPVTSPRTVQSPP